jgi:DNA repair exonuclease SbcCD ATPase subunit
LIIKSIEVFNFGPFLGKQKIEFTPDERVILVQGTYAGSPDRSNRSGKSSFVEAPLYAFFGEVRDHTREVDCIHHGQKEMWVEVVLDNDGKEITIKRGRNSDNEPLLEISGLKGKKGQKEAEFEALIGSNFTDFVNTRFFRQNQMHGFMEAKPVERKEMLQAWFQLTRWEGYAAKAKAKANDQKVLLNSLQTQQTIKNDQLQKLVIPDITVIKSQIATIESEIQVSEKALQDAEAVVVSTSSDPTTIKRDIDLITNKLSSCRPRVAQLEAQVKAIDQIKKDLAVYVPPNPSAGELYNQSEAFKTEIIELEKNKVVFNTQIKQKSTLCGSTSCFTGVCPVDQQPCEKGTRVGDFNKTIEAEINVLKAQLAAIEVIVITKQRLLRATEVDWKSAETTELRITKYREVAVQEPNIQRELLTLQTFMIEQGAKLIELKETLASINVEEQNKRVMFVAYLTEQLKGAKAKYTELVRSLGAAEAAITQKAELEKDLVELAAKVATTSQEYHRWLYVLSLVDKNGIPALLVENSLQTIEDTANVILTQISPDTRVEFSTYKELTTKQTNCSVCGSLYDKAGKCTSCGYGSQGNKFKDEITLKLYEFGREILFHQDSGGGRVLVSLALRLSLSKLLSNQSKCRMLVLDEVFGSLDAVNRNQLASLIFNSICNLLGFKQIFVITHTPLGEDSGYAKVVVTRDGSHSTISKEK